jgi:acylphosphatase
MNGHGDSCRRLCMMVRGAVQGVGFRPFVFRLATEHNPAGWVKNSPLGAHIEVEGRSEHLDSFLERFKRDALPLGIIHSVDPIQLDAVGYAGFEIRESSQDGVRFAWIVQDSRSRARPTSVAQKTRMAEFLQGTTWTSDLSAISSGGWQVNWLQA